MLKLVPPSPVYCFQLAQAECHPLNRNLMNIRIMRAPTRWPNRKWFACTLDDTGKPGHCGTVWVWGWTFNQAVERITKQINLRIRGAFNWVVRPVANKDLRWEEIQL